MSAAGATPPHRWRLALLGRLQASDGAETIERFGGGSVAALAARLALYPGRRHAREELVELLWPEAPPEAGRNRLRQTLFALRALLEPPAAIPRPVLVADRAGIRAVEGALACDVIEFERAVREARHAEALALYAGELMPGHYEEWIVEERRRLAALAERSSAALEHEAAAPRPPAPAAKSAPAAARRDRSPLPLYLTRFFGREDEAARLDEALGAHRLVTLLGPGGSGKTRLATEACLRRRADAGHAGELLLFVPLVGCASRPALLEALAGALHLQAAADDGALGRLVEALEARPALVVLDNFEQLVEAGGGVVAALVEALPALRVLITSRRPLGLDGERHLALAPLPLPAAAATVREAAASAAVGLFVDRARAVRADFHLGARNAAVLVELVRVLEGLPLALELAASRVRAISPAEMLDHLRPPVGGRRTAGLALLARGGVRAGHDPRHASMLRTIEWSWQLLTPALQGLLGELTVFEGGFDAAAATAVASAPGVVAVQLDALVAHSLLVVQRSDAEGDAATRFALDESIREFAAAALDEAAGRRLRARHRRWLAGWGAGLPATPPLAALRAESRNVGAALASALADGVPREGTAVMVALGRGLPDTAVPATQRAAFAAALVASPADALASRGHTLLARLCLAASLVEPARSHAEHGLALARSLHAAEPEGPARSELDGLLARALQVSASVAWRTGRDAARSEALLDEAEPLAEAADLGVHASSLALRAFIANIAHRDLARAEALHGRALALWERAGDAVSANNGRYNLAVCALRARRFDSALEQLAIVSAWAERQHDWRLLSQAHNVAGEAQAGLRAWPAAAASYRKSLELAWSALARPAFAYALWNLPAALAHGRQPAAAATLAGAAEHFWVTHMASLDASDQRDLRRMRRLAAAQIGAAATARAWRSGAALPLPEVVALALESAAPND